jgi:hypothetical protein
MFESFLISSHTAYSVNVLLTQMNALSLLFNRIVFTRLNWCREAVNVPLSHPQLTSVLSSRTHPTLACRVRLKLWFFLFSLDANRLVAICKWRRSHVYFSLTLIILSFSSFCSSTVTLIFCPFFEFASQKRNSVKSTDSFGLFQSILFLFFAVSCLGLLCRTLFKLTVFLDSFVERLCRSFWRRTAKSLTSCFQSRSVRILYVSLAAEFDVFDFNCSIFLNLSSR